MINRIKSSFVLDNDSGVTFIDEKFTILNHLSIKLRALVVIILSCDVFVGGVNNISATKLNKIIEELRLKHDTDYVKVMDDLLSWLINKKKYNKGIT